MFFTNSLISLKAYLVNSPIVSHSQSRVESYLFPPLNYKYVINWLRYIPFISERIPVIQISNVYQTANVYHRGRNLIINLDNEQQW